jgi:formylglycine-generating enzyme required for sulfatase activity
MSGLCPVYKTGGGVVIKNSTDGNGAQCDAAVADWSTNGYRLPTEGEWQYAASYKDGSTWTQYNCASGGLGAYTGTSSTDYPNFSPYAWYGNSLSSPTGNTKSTKDVGTKIANQLDIHDMSGNVWEWCWDWSGTWPGVSTDYRGPGSGSSRVRRGGSWNNIAVILQVGYRDYIFAIFEFNNLGLRLTRR